MKIKLRVYLNDGRELSVCDDYLSILARLQFAATLPDYAGFDMEAA